MKKESEYRYTKYYSAVLNGKQSFVLFKEITTTSLSKEYCKSKLEN